MRADLPRAFLTRPIAHRALHDAAAGRPENALEAIEAAAVAGFPVEIDIQLSSDGVAMVFHDFTLDRMTGETGPVRARSAEDLARIPLLGGRTGIPTLRVVLGMVQGRVPVLLEIKDQDGALGPDVGALERAVADAARGYGGPLAVMSFNPHSVAAMADLAPSLPRGLVTDPFLAADWPVAEARLAELRGIPDFERVGASFISHKAADLTAPAVTALKRDGVPILCWTIRSEDDERRARRVADNVTFEGYLPG